MSDSEVIQQVLQGNRDLYRLLVEKYQAMVFRTCMGFVHNKDDADDLSQEVFIQAYQSLSKFGGKSSFSTWIYRIAVNASLNKTRKSSRNYIFQRIDSMFSGDKGSGIFLISPETDGPENLMIRSEHHEWLQKALDSLPENQRTAIVLSKYEDLPQKQIAEIMDTTEGAVEALIQRAKANLRKKLSDS